MRHMKRVRSPRSPSANRLGANGVPHRPDAWSAMRERTKWPRIRAPCPAARDAATRAAPRPSVEGERGLMTPARRAADERLRIHAPSEFASKKGGQRHQHSAWPASGDGWPVPRANRWPGAIGGNTIPRQPAPRRTAARKPRTGPVRARHRTIGVMFIGRERRGRRRSRETLGRPRRSPCPSPSEKQPQSIMLLGRARAGGRANLGDERRRAPHGLAAATAVTEYAVQFAHEPLRGTLMAIPPIGGKQYGHNRRR